MFQEWEINHSNIDNFRSSINLNLKLVLFISFKPHRIFTEIAKEKRKQTPFCSHRLIIPRVSLLFHSLLDFNANKFPKSYVQILVLHDTFSKKRKSSIKTQHKNGENVFICRLLYKTRKKKINNLTSEGDPRHDAEKSDSAITRNGMIECPLERPPREWFQCVHHDYNMPIRTQASG